jgi:hypothetical protein
LDTGNLLAELMLLGKLTVPADVTVGAAEEWWWWW